MKNRVNGPNLPKNGQLVKFQLSFFVALLLVISGATCAFASDSAPQINPAQDGLFTEPDPNQDPAPPWYRKLIGQIRFGTGFPSSEIKESPHVEVQLGYAISRNTIVGVFYGPTNAKKLDTVYFPATGYTEKRTYKLDTNLIGLWTNILMTDRLALVLAAALSNTNSELETVESDGPLTIEPGHPSSANANLAYRVGVNYLYPINSIVIGPEVGYSSSSSLRDAEVKEFYGSVILRFDSRLL